MTGDQWVSVITAFFGGVLALMAAFPAFYLAIKNANKATVNAVHVNTELLEKVEVQTNSSLMKATMLTDQLRESAVTLAASTMNTKQGEYQDALKELETLRAENMRLALLAHPSDTPTQELKP